MSFNVKNINWLWAFTRLSIASIAVLLAYIVFIVVDSSFLDEKKERAVVLYTSHRAAMVTPQITVVNGIAVTTYIHHPAQWSAVVSPEYSDSFVRCSINSITYHLLNTGSKVVVKIAEGRFSGSIYCKGISIDEQ